MVQVQRTQVKICGIRRRSDVAVCRDLGVDFVGFNFFRGSKRFIEPAEARAVWHGSGIPSVGVVVRPSATEVEMMLRVFPELCALQFHGDESDSELAGFAALLPKQVRLWQVRRVGHEGDLSLPSYIGASLVLFDSKVRSEMGGTGVAFTWDWLRQKPLPASWGVAGGVRPENVDGLRSYEPKLVDVSSGVESAPGVKDPEKMKDLVAKVRRWD
jgi:phosphoribosylanthranilate isomerase